MKKSLIIPFVLAVCFAAYAFTSNSDGTNQNRPTAVQWEFIGNNDLDAMDPDNYRKITGSQTFVCDSEDETVCTILADEDPNSNPSDPRPLFSSGTNPVDDASLYEATRRSVQ